MFTDFLFSITTITIPNENKGRKVVRKSSKIHRNEDDLEEVKLDN